jgi:hypothetical protein
MLISEFDEDAIPFGFSEGFDLNLVVALQGYTPIRSSKHSWVTGHGSVGKI